MFRRPKRLKYVVHAVVGPPRSGRSALLPPRDTVAYFYCDAARNRPMTLATFCHRIDATCQQAHRERARGEQPQEATFVLDNAPPLLRLDACLHTHWTRMTIWLVYDRLDAIPGSTLHAVTYFYLFRADDVQHVMNTIPQSHHGHGQDPNYLPIRQHSHQCWVIPRWHRGIRRNDGGPLGRIPVRLFEAPVYYCLREALRRRRWKKWIRQWIVMARFRKRLVPRATLLMHRACKPPNGRIYLEVVERWRTRVETLTRDLGLRMSNGSGGASSASSSSL